MSKFFKNIDGTTKPSFTIGANGIIIEPSAIYEYNEDGSIKKDTDGNPIYKVNISSLAITKVGSEEKYILNNSLIRDIKKDKKGLVTTFFLYDGTTLDISGNVNIEGDVTEGNLIIFKNAEDKTIKDAGVHINTTGVSHTADGYAILNNNELPTTFVMSQYMKEYLDFRVGTIDTFFESLDKRLSGNLTLENREEE